MKDCLMRSYPRETTVSWRYSQCLPHPIGLYATGW